MATIKERGVKARKRANKVSWLNNKNKKARALYTTGVYPQAVYGMEGVGYSPWSIKTIRSMAADSMGCSKRGRCPITAIAVAKGLEWDPYVRGPIQLIKEWAAIFPKIEPRALAEAWVKMEDHVEAPKGKAWARVRGPMGATHMHLEEMGWAPLFQTDPIQMVGLIDSDGNTWEFNNAITWHDFQETLTEERSKQLWEEASKHRGGGGMERGVDMTVSNKHYNRLVKERKTAEASALMSIQTGALWSPQRLQEADIPAENGAHKCPLCGKEGTDEGHLFWECPKVCQNPDARIQKTNRYCDE